MKKANALVGQSGGPTSVINASLQGLIEGVQSSKSIATLYGMKFGIDGFMNGGLWNLSSQSDSIVNGLSSTPSSALGSSRYKLKDSDLSIVRDALKSYDIRYLFLIGGNDTMDTIARIEAYCKKNKYEMKGIGIPKTVDNDLFGTHYTPGYPSAARYNALSVQQSGRLARDMQRVDSFTIFQTIGRDAGWLAAATALARQENDDPPHLIYCPELPFEPDKFVSDAVHCIDRIGYVSVVVSEGIRYADGTPVSAAHTKDRFGNVEYGATGGSSAALALHQILAKATGLRGEFQIPESLPMCASDRAESRDIKRAIECGKEACRIAEAGGTGVMVSLVLDKIAPGGFSYGTTPLSDVAVRAKEMPSEMMNGRDVTQVFLDYIRPLVEPLPAYVSLEAL